MKKQKFMKPLLSTCLIRHTQVHHKSHHALNAQISRSTIRDRFLWSLTLASSLYIVRGLTIPP